MHKNNIINGSKSKTFVISSTYRSPDCSFVIILDKLGNYLNSCNILSNRLTCITGSFINLDILKLDTKTNKLYNTLESYELSTTIIALINSNSSAVKPCLSNHSHISIEIIICKEHIC